jgi:hypothetical protein
MQFHCFRLIFHYFFFVPVRLSRPGKAKHDPNAKSIVHSVLHLKTCSNRRRKHNTHFAYEASHDANKRLLSPRRKSWVRWEVASAPGSYARGRLRPHCRWRLPLLASLRPPLLAGLRPPCWTVRAAGAGLDLASPRRRGWPRSRRNGESRGGAERRRLRRWWSKEAEQRPAGVGVGAEGERETRRRWGGAGRRRCASCVCAAGFGVWWLGLCRKMARFGCIFLLHVTYTME